MTQIKRHKLYQRILMNKKKGCAETHPNPNRAKPGDTAAARAATVAEPSTDKLSAAHARSVLTCIKFEHIGERESGSV